MFLTSLALAGLRLKGNTMNQKYCPCGEFFLHSRQNTVAGYCPKMPDFVNFNFSDYFLCE